MLLQSEVKRSFRFGGTTPNKLKLPEIADFSTVLEIKQSQKQMNETNNLSSNLVKEINQDVFELVKEPLVDVKKNNENVISIPDIPESLDNSQIK